MPKELRAWPKLTAYSAHLARSLHRRVCFINIAGAPECLKKRTVSWMKRMAYLLARIATIPRYISFNTLIRPSAPSSTFFKNDFQFFAFFLFSSVRKKHLCPTTEGKVISYRAQKKYFLVNCSYVEQVLRLMVYFFVTLLSFPPKRLLLFRRRIQLDGGKFVGCAESSFVVIARQRYRFRSSISFLP